MSLAQIKQFELSGYVEESDVVLVFVEEERVLLVDGRFVQIFRDVLVYFEVGDGLK